MKKLIFSIVLVLTFMQGGFAQEDLEGCKDHPLFTRMPGYYILECTQNYNQLDFYDKGGQDVKLEGTLTYAWYVFYLESGKTEPSRFQIIKNYANAITKIGGVKIYEEDGLGCYELKKNGKEYRIKVACTNNSDILLNVLELEAMKQDIAVNEMLDALNKDGFITLNILFETGKSIIQPESLPIIDQVYQLMDLDKTLKISIEGHTDNVGNAESNKKLSNDRAKSVVDALIAKGVDKSRLAYVGWGQEKPVADNRNEQGKAKNRRVEIIKLP
ncbi:MAG: OmpA family protein [Bacteroidetes bacterium]|nr:OmpA family protein [Bacteroidota bacterium]